MGTLLVCGSCLSSGTLTYAIPPGWVQDCGSPVPTRPHRWSCFGKRLRSMTMISPWTSSWITTIFLRTPPKSTPLRSVSYIYRITRSRISSRVWLKQALEEEGEVRFLAGNHAASVFCEILFSGAFRRSTFSQPFVVGFCTRGQRMLPILHLRPIDGSNFGIAAFTPIGFKRLGGRMRPNDASKSGQTMVQITEHSLRACLGRPRICALDHRVGLRLCKAGESICVGSYSLRILKSKYSATSFFVLGKLPAGLTENAGIPPLHEGDVKCCP